MRIIQTFLLLTLVCSLFSACKKDGVAKPEDATATSQAATPQPLPAEIVQNLVDNCNSFDLIFHELPISTSGSDNASCRNMLTFMKTDAATIDARSRSLGRYFFKQGATDLLAAEVYFDEYTQALEFITNDKKRYVNQMSENGKNYFNYFMSQYQQMLNNAPQQ